MARTTTALVCLTALIAAGGAATAGSGEFVEYPQFRYIGGLPGNGWAVDSEGQVGWEGAMSQAIPLGYTPSRGAFALGFHSGAYSGIDLGWSGDNVNGTLAGTLGFLPLGHGASLTIDAVDSEWDMVIDLQAQVLEETDSRPAVSVGVLDLLNAREAILGVWPEGPKARSFWAAATKRFEAGDRPLHVTLGFGTDRYHDRPFAGVSYDLHERVKVLAEYDGWNMNAATAVQLLPRKKPPGIYKDEPVERDDALVLFLGAADLQRAVVGLSYARRDLF